MERIKLKIKVIIPIYDRLGYMIPSGCYEILVSRVTQNHIYGTIGQIEFSLPMSQFLKIISYHQYPNINVEQILTRVSTPPVDSNIISPINSNSCMICLSSMNELPITLPCQHKFHRECISRWLHTNNTCPCCRARISTVVRTRLGLNIYPSNRSSNRTSNRSSNRSSHRRSSNRSSHRRSSNLRRSSSRLSSLPNLFR